MSLFIKTERKTGRRRKRLFAHPLNAQFFHQLHHQAKGRQQVGLARTIGAEQNAQLVGVYLFFRGCQAHAMMRKPAFFC